MWAFAYIVTALFAPWVGDLDAFANFAIYLFLGCWIVFTLLLSALVSDMLGQRIVRCLWFVLGLVEVFGGITSWAGLGIWNVPFPNKELFQVSMAFADLLSAVFMFYLAIDTT